MRWLAASTMALLAASCAKPATEIVVVVRSDLPLASVQLAGQEESATLFSVCNCVDGAGCASLPVSLGLVPDGSGDHAVRVLATGFSNDSCSTALVSQSATVRFVEEKTLELDLDLSAICKGVVCAMANQTCRDGICEDDTIATLPEYPLDRPDLAMAAPPDLGVDLAVSLDLGPDASKPTLAFGPEHQIAIQIGATPVVGDLTHDGRDDLIALGASAAVLVSNGDGSFTGAAGLGAVASGGAIRDFDGDGVADVVLAEQGQVIFWPGKGDGSFGASKPALVGNGTPIGFAVADLNGDAKLDVAVLDPGGNLVIAIGDGTGAWPNLSFYSTGFGAFVFADVYGSGRLALVGTDGNDPDGVVWSNDGKGALLKGMVFTNTVGTTPNALVAAELNGDGKIDLVLADGSSGELTVLFGDGAGNFAAQPGEVVNNGATPLGAADFDLDGDIDLAVLSGLNQLAVVCLNNGAGLFPTTFNIQLTHAADSIAVGDFDGNGKPDLVVCSSTSSLLSVFLNLSK